MGDDLAAATAGPEADGTRLIDEPAGTAAGSTVAVDDTRTGSSVAAWAVLIRGFSAPEEDEVAGVFEHRPDAARYAEWWNGEEIVRYGSKSPLRAELEEIDYYPHGAWRPPKTTPTKLVRLLDKW